MATRKQKALRTDKELQRRLAALNSLRNIRRKIYQAHGNFPEIDDLIRETREGTPEQAHG